MCLLTLLDSILPSPFSVVQLLHPSHLQTSFLTKMTVCNTFSTIKLTKDMSPLPSLLIIRVEEQFKQLHLKCHFNFPYMLQLHPWTPSLSCDPPWGQQFQSGLLNTGLYLVRINYIIKVF